MDIAARTLAIARDYPNLQVGVPSFIQTRHSTVVEVDVDGVPHIFKFPHNEKIDWRQEVTLLKYLGTRDVGRIPEPDCVGESAAYFGYRMIEGEAARGLVQEQHDVLASDENAAYLANFLLKLHHMDLGRTPVRFDPANDYPKRIEKMLQTLPYEATDLRDFLTALIARMGHDPQDVPRHLLHNDFQLTNMLVQSGTSRIIAMVDFGFAALGDRHRDFHQLERQHPQLMEMVLERYNSSSSATPIDRNRIALLGAVDQAAYYAAACTTLIHDVIARAEILDGLRTMSRRADLRSML